MTFLERLKAETGPAHERIEREIRLPERLSSREAYRGLLRRFYGFHNVWEPEAQRSLADPSFFDRRRKTHLLVRDLRALGMEDAAIEKLPLCHPVPLMPTRAAALGSMYVVEGSTLGGAVISKEIERALGLGVQSGCAYFRSYGADVGRMWTSFRAHLLAHASSRDENEIIAVAIATFETLRIWLCTETLDS